jgi:hypothetical protein
VDPELRAYLDARFTETQKTMDTMRAEAAARDAETRQTLRDEIKAVEQRAVARDAEARREAGAMHDAIIAEIRALPEGLSTFQRAGGRPP